MARILATPVTRILYSFRRCPYAMRARLALDVSEQVCELREIVLKNKPEAMLRASRKGTVPVLVDDDGSVVDESLDIMLWALRRHDPEGWLTPSGDSLDAMLTLVHHIDDHFKQHLDRYKYPTRFENADALLSRNEASRDLRSLEHRLEQTAWLSGDRIALTDMAIAPFVRQFANVDAAWFAREPWPRLHGWLERIIKSQRFLRIMRSVPAWTPDAPGITFPFRQ